MAWVPFMGGATPWLESGLGSAQEAERKLTALGDLRNTLTTFFV